MPHSHPQTFSSAGANTTVEKLDLSDFEFDVPCDAVSKKGNTCVLPATWILVLRPHCAKAVPSEQLICQRHYEYVVNGGGGYCPACSEPNVVVRDFIAQLERIKS